MFISRSHTARPASSYSFDDDDNANMFIPQPGLPGRNSGPGRGDEQKPTPPRSSTAAPIRHMDIDIDDSDIFIPRSSGDRQLSLPNRQTVNHNAKHPHPSSHFEHEDRVDPLVRVDGMEFTPRQDISRPAPPADVDTSEAALKLIRWAMQARALLATIEALQSKFKFN